MILLRLFWEYFKVGLFAVGGGLATFPFLKELGARTGWFTQAQLADMLAVSESTPGPIGVNMATYVGYHIAGIPGAVVATLGLIAPSVIIMLVSASSLWPDWPTPVSPVISTLQSYLATVMASSSTAFISLLVATKLGATERFCTR